MKWTWTKTALVFLAGILIGAAAGRWTARWDGHRQDPDKRIERGVRHLSRELDLTDEQRAEVRKVFEAKRNTFETWREERRAARRAAWDETARNIEAVLTPEQKEKFAELRERWKERRGKRGHSRQ